MFKDREDGGLKLANLVKSQGLSVDVVLAVPQGGLPVGRAVANALGVELNVIVARRISAPGNPDLALGAVTDDGTAWLNRSLIKVLGIDDEYVEKERESQATKAREELKEYDTGELDPDGKDVMIVDDGIATGTTISACIERARREKAETVIVGVPVVSASVVEQLRAQADEVLGVETPPHFESISEFYESFNQVSKKEASKYLR
ncbi:MAG: phosphoribosyltransferase family protein [Halobacteria archaeon]|nr:phosphoribosyltransferase family protein [Halobacteria archaeon]